MKIKKRFFILEILIIGFFIFSSFSVYALGMGPAKTEVNFVPNYEFSVDYIIVDVSSNQELEVYAEGDLKEYVKFDKTNLIGEEGFKATIKLPDTIAKPGENKLFIGVKEVESSGGGIATRLAIEALIVVRVPYPGKYAEISFSASNANVGEPINFAVGVNNLGKEDITAKTNIEIYSGDAIIETLDLGAKEIKTQTSASFEKDVSTADYKPGPYKAIATVDYGKIAKAEREFKIGTLFFNITNWTSEVEKGKINPFYIEIESLWNSQIENIYAEANVTNQEESVDFFKTPSVSLGPWQKTVLKSYLNAEKLDTGGYKANIELFYADKTTSKLVDIKVIESGILGLIKNNILLIIVIVAFVVWIIYFFWRRYGRAIKKNKKREIEREKK